MRRFTIAVVLFGVAATAMGGDCREELRPLLLTTTPDPVRLDTVRRQCAAEALSGDAEALYQLALTELGLGGRWQPERALPRIREAAERGISEAQYWLAWQYEAGPLLPDDAALALDWYRRAADGRHRLAVARLASAYENGELGLSADPAEALRYRALQSQCARGERPADSADEAIR
jgi:TPR repeat protein